MAFDPLTGTAIHWLAKIFSWTKNPFTRMLFLKTYIYSHKKWLERHQLGAYWSKCGSHLEYSTYLVSELDPEPCISKIAFRAKGQQLKNVSMIFEASSGVVRYQHPISIADVSDAPIVCYLSSIPPQEVVLLENDSRIRFSWHSFKLKNVLITLADGATVREFNSMESSVTYDWFLNSRWQRRWGQLWNLNEIEFAKKELRMYWLFGFGHRFPKVFVPYSVAHSFSVAFVARKMVTSSIVWVMTRKSMLDIQYWLAIWSRLFLFDEHSRLIWRWSEKKSKD